MQEHDDTLLTMTYGQVVVILLIDAVFTETALIAWSLADIMKHFFELGQKVRLDGIGIFKVGFSSIGTTEKEDCGAATITTRRVLIQPESQRVVVGQTVNKQGKITQKFVIAKTLVKDVVFEETYDTSLQPEASGGEGGEGGNG